MTRAELDKKYRPYGVVIDYEGFHLWEGKKVREWVVYHNIYGRPCLAHSLEEVDTLASGIVQYVVEKFWKEGV